MSKTTLKVGETFIVTFDFSKELELKRRDDFSYSVGEFITIGAYVYECTNAGKSAPQIPESVSTTIGATVDDGTVEWTVRDYSTDGTDTISTRTVTASSGLTVDSSAIAKSVHVNVTFTADTVGSNYLLCEIVTLAGETLRHKHPVYVEQTA